MNKAIWLALIGGFAVLSLSAIAHPNAERERSCLARLAAEIILLEQQITSAERQADSEAKFTFDYDELRSTLKSATMQIDRHIKSQQRQPRNLGGKTDG